MLPHGFQLHGCLPVQHGVALYVASSLGNTPTVYRRGMTLPLNAWRGFARMPYVDRVSVVGGERLQVEDGPFQITLKAGGGAPNV